MRPRPCPHLHPKHVSATILPVLSAIVNLFTSTGTFSNYLKKPLVTALLKKPSLDKDILNNSRPISIITLVSKIIQRIVESYQTNSSHLTPCTTLINLHIINITQLILLFILYVTTSLQQ